ncbi:MAG: Gfo/Idh/MocA family oxidoreductase [Terracidiphilus sp.]|jgi:predicted dehydrogenase
MIRVGLVGFGMAGRVFHAPLLSSVEGLELAAVVERNSDTAAARYPGIQVYRSLQAMLADASLGLFVLATPNGTHVALAKELLKAGKNVVVDKPMAMTSAEAAELIGLAKKHKVLLAPFQNRRWDSDFLTLQKLLHEGSLGRLVAFESRLDRWRPAPLTERLWKESAEAGGGKLLDLGPHLVDQALVLFGKPEAVGAEVVREKDGPGVDDAFAIRLRYPGLIVTLGANSLSLPAAPRFHLRGTKGGYVKNGVDPQEAALNKVTHIDDPAWGQEPAANWGVLHVGIEGGSVTRPVPALPGDYRLYYAGIRDALLGKAPAPVTGIDGWRVARVLEWAAESSKKRCEIVCDWSDEPK